MHNNFKVMRERAGMTQQAVADAVGIERSTIAKWETGAALPRVGNLYQMAALYKCRVSDLIPDGPCESEAAAQ